jgi:peptide deformylase
MIHDLVHYNDPILKQAIDAFDFSNPPVDPNQLAIDLAESMIQNNGMGLAANQIGLPYRVFVMTGNPILCCFNPRIVDYNDEFVLLEEKCLSFPDMFVKVKRPKTIKVRYTEPNGDTVTRVFDGLTSRIFQHELCHLNGTTFLDVCGQLEKERALKKLKKLSRTK